MAYQLINLWQSKEERQEKYWLARSLGLHFTHARRLRDWRLSKIERYFNLDRTGPCAFQSKLLLIYNNGYYHPQ